MKKEFIKQNAGIDIAKDDFKVCFSGMSKDYRMVVQGSHTFANNHNGFKLFVDWIQGKSDASLPVHFTMEATGVYYEALTYYLFEKQQIVHVVLPNQAKKYGQGLGVRSKTDKIDAKILAQMGLERPLRQWEPISPNLLILKQLTRERDSLVRQRTNAANYLHAYSHQGKPNKESIHRSKELIVFLDKQVKEIEAQIASIVKQDKVLEQRLKYLLSIPGVGLLTAVTIVAETNGFAGITNAKQLTGYAGLDIRIAESGHWKGKSKITKKGNSHIRKALYFPAFTKIKFDLGTKVFYDRLTEIKGVKMVAAVAVQRKLLGLTRKIHYFLVKLGVKCYLCGD